MAHGRQSPGKSREDSSDGGRVSRVYAYDMARAEAGYGRRAFVFIKIGKMPSPMTLVEQRLDLTRYVPEAFGTADCIIVG